MSLEGGLNDSSALSVGGGETKLILCTFRRGRTLLKV